ncbi:hypothetical protein Bbelb_288710 [Branchiostoma belcheri]|nr:hypothetical protein Bbelb_288710 [Branchiostoma belcheri]
MSRIFGTEVRSIGNGDDRSERRRPGLTFEAIKAGDFNHAGGLRGDDESWLQIKTPTSRHRRPLHLDQLHQDATPPTATSSRPTNFILTNQLQVTRVIPLKEWFCRRGTLTGEMVSPPNAPMSSKEAR